MLLPLAQTATETAESEHEAFYAALAGSAATFFSVGIGLLASRLVTLLLAA